MERFRQDLSNDMAEHRPILKNNQNTTAVLVSLSKQVYFFPKTGLMFLLCSLFWNQILKLFQNPQSNGKIIVRYLR